MTTKEILTANLKGWCDEAAGLGISAEKLPEFLAGRLGESGVIKLEENQRVVRADLGGRKTLVRLLGFDQRLKMLQYEGIDRPSMGLMPISAVDPGDHEKLADIIGGLPSQPLMAGVPQVWHQGAKIPLSRFSGAAKEGAD